MKLPRVPHRWRVSPREAVAIQGRLAARVREAPLGGGLRLLAGVDAAFSRDGRWCIAAAVLWRGEDSAVVEQRTAVRPVAFPYIPGLLSFREAPAVIAALRKLRARPELLIYDGHGLAHPRRFGVACHVGVLCDLPTVGCAKSRLVGTHREPGRRRGDRAALLENGEKIGIVLRTQHGVRPVFVSVGHRVDLDAAAQVVLACATRYRLPEPTRLADQLVAAVKRRGEGAREMRGPGGRAKRGQDGG